MRSMLALIAAVVALKFGLVPARAMPITTVTANVDIAHVIPVAQGCGPGAYHVGGVCRSSSGPVIGRYRNGVLSSNAAGCMVYRTPFGLRRFCH